MTTTYFFDSYTFLELIDGNKNYQPYSSGKGVITTKLNLMEIHYILLRRTGKKEAADKYYEKFKEFCIDIDDETIKKANELKFASKSKNLSYIDCVGYTLAKARGIKFLTGDKEFENMENVEFVK